MDTKRSRYSRYAFRYISLIAGHLFEKYSFWYERSSIDERKGNEVQRRRSMLYSNVSFEVGLLRKFILANGTTKLGFDTALVVLMSPERREQLVATIAVGASVLFLPSSLLFAQFLPNVLFAHCRSFVTLKGSVTFQRGHQRKLSIAIGAQVFPRAISAHLVLIALKCHGPQVPGVQGGINRCQCRQRQYRPIGGAVFLCVWKRTNEIKDF